jgi:hypothetical protein
VIFTALLFRDTEQVPSHLGNRITLYSMRLLEDGRFFASDLATATVPFTFSGRAQYKAVFRLMAIFHVCIWVKYNEMYVCIPTKVLLLFS